MFKGFRPDKMFARHAETGKAHTLVFSDHTWSYWGQDVENCYYGENNDDCFAVDLNEFDAFECVPK